MRPLFMVIEMDKNKTNVMRLLDAKKIRYKSHDYENTGAISGTDVAAAMGQDPHQVFKTLENALTEFVNNRRWTQAHYEKNERIRCSITMVVKEYDETQGRWNCELTVQSSRPVWQSAYQTTVFNFKDTDFWGKLTSDRSGILFNIDF